MIKSPINNGLLQSDLDVAGFNLLNYAPGGGGTVHGIPAGGTAGQSLTKIDGTDYNAHWSTVTGGTGTNPQITVNVKDAPYNAAGNGTTDDTTAINNAIAAVVAAGGGTVFFPRGIYLCNGAFEATYKSILQIPFINNAASSPVTLQLLGENMPAWGVVSVPLNFAYVSTIKTTRTDGSSADHAILAGNAPRGDGLNPTYQSMSGVMVMIKNMAFLCPDNPTMGGIRLDGVGHASVEDVLVSAGAITAAANPSEPTHGTTGVWMPSSINWSMNWMNRVNSMGFDTGIKTGEHLRAPWIQVWACKSGVAFEESMYPSWANILGANCQNHVKFLGYHTVDLLLETEHSPAADWTSCLHDVSDPSNYGTGIIKGYVGHGTPGSACTGLSLEGCSKLTIIDLCSGVVGLASTGLLAGKIYASDITLGYTDTGLIRSNTSEVKITNGSTGLGDLVIRTTRLNALTVATLPASPALGQLASISDGTASLAWGATVTGGGTAKYLVWWNGVNWTVAGK